MHSDSRWANALRPASWRGVATAPALLLSSTSGKPTRFGLCWPSTISTMVASSCCAALSVPMGAAAPSSTTHRRASPCSGASATCWWRSKVRRIRADCWTRRGTSPCWMSLPVTGPSGRVWRLLTRHGVPPNLRRGGGGRTRSVAQGGGILAARGLRVGGARAGRRRGRTPRRRTRDLAKQREARRGTERGVERDRCRRWSRRAPQIGPACDRARRAARRRRTGFAIGGPGSRGDRGGGGRGRVERSAGCSRYRAKPARSGRGAPLLAPRSCAQASYRPRFPGPAADEAAAASST